MATPNKAELKQIVREQWTSGAAAWEKWSEKFIQQSREATDAVIDAANPSIGMNVLDLASGTGEPAFSLAAAVGKSGHVTATDLVPEMLAAAERLAHARKISNISFQIADAESLPFDDEQFDLATCRFGIMFFPDYPKALSEVRRVLKPRGRAVFVAWDTLERNPFFASTIGVFMRHVEFPVPEPDAPGVFRFAPSGMLSTALREVGFDQVIEQRRSIAWPWPGTVEEAWESVRELGAPFRKLLESLTPELREKVEGEVLSEIRRYWDGQQVRFHANIVVASAIKP